MAFGDEIVQESYRLGLGEPETDGRVWSLEAGPAMKGGARKDTGEIVWFPIEPAIANNPPDYEPMTGSYLDVSRRAAFLNKRQRDSGFQAMVFYPHPVQKGGAL